MQTEQRFGVRHLPYIISCALFAFHIVPRKRPLASGTYTHWRGLASSSASAAIPPGQASREPFLLVTAVKKVGNAQLLPPQPLGMKRLCSRLSVAVQRNHAALSLTVRNLHRKRLSVICSHHRWRSEGFGVLLSLFPFGCRMRERMRRATQADHAARLHQPCWCRGRRVTVVFDSSLSSVLTKSLIPESATAPILRQIACGGFICAATSARPMAYLRMAKQTA